MSDDKYLKLYKIKSNLVDYNKNYLESSLDFTHESDDFFLGLNASIFETLKENYNDKYEYILPEISLEKVSLVMKKLGILDLQSNIKVHNYDTNKTSKFVTNSFNWNKNLSLFENGISNKIF